MAAGDLTEKQASQSVKLAGADPSTGAETYFMDVTSEGRGKIQQPASNTGGNTRPSITSVSSTILAANPARKFAIIINNSGANAWLKYQDAAVSLEGIFLAAGSMWTINAPTLWTGAVNAIKQGGGTIELDVFEAT